MNVLIGALGATFSADEGARRQAEATLGQMADVAGYVPALLAVVTSGAPLEVRQAAAIQLKNVVVARWSPRRRAQGAVAPLGAADKAAVRAGLVAAVCGVPRLLQKQLCVALQSVAFHDYPGAWPDLVSAAVAALGAPDRAVAYGALLALRAVYRNLDYVKQRDALRVALDAAAPAVFGALAGVAAAAARVPVPTPETLAFERVVLRIFVSAVRAFVPPHFQDARVLAQWLGLVGALLARPLAVVPRPPGVAAAAWWRAPARAAEFLLAWLYKYGRPALVPARALRRATAPFRQSAAPAAARTLVECVARRAQLGTPERVVATALAFVGACSKFPTVYAALAPRLADIVTHVVFPLACATPAEEALAVRDPAEYLRAEFGADSCCTSSDLDGCDADGSEGSSSSSSSLRLSATNALVNLCQRKPRDTLVPLMQFIARTLAATSAAIAAATAGGDAAAAAAAARTKFGALVVVTALDSTLKRSELFRAQLEPMLLQHVVPELASAHVLLRAMACFTFARYADIAWSPAAAPAFGAALERVAALTHDAQLVVAAFATLSLKHLVQVPAGKDLLRPRLADIFETFFRFIDMPDVDNDDMVMTLEVFAETYRDEIAPFAGDVCVRLCRSFLDTLRSLADSAASASAAAAAAPDDNDLRMFKAIGCLETLSTIVGAVHTAPALVHRLAVGVFVPFFGVVLGLSTDLTADYMDDLLALLQLLTCYADPLPPELWSLYAPLFRVADAYPSATALLVGPLENMVSKTPDALLADPARLHALAAAVARILRDPDWDEQEALKACQLAEIPLLYLRGRIDPYASALLSLVLPRLFPQGQAQAQGQEGKKGEEEEEEEETPVCLQVLLLELVLDVLWYDARLGLAQLAAAGALAPVLAALARLAPSFARTYDKQVAVLGLASVLRVPYAALPPALQPLLGTVVVRLLRFLRDLKQQEFVTAQADALDALEGEAAAKGVKAQTLLPDTLRHDPFNDDLWDDSDAEDDDDEDEDIDDDGDDGIDAYAAGHNHDDGEDDGDEGEAGEDDDDGDGGDDDALCDEGGMLEDEYDGLCDLDDEDVQNPVTEAPHRACALDAIAGLAAGPLACPETVAVCNALPDHYKQQIRLWQQDPRFNTL